MVARLVGSSFSRLARCSVVGIDHRRTLGLHTITYSCLILYKLHIHDIFLYQNIYIRMFGWRNAFLHTSIIAKLFTGTYYMYIQKIFTLNHLSIYIHIYICIWKPYTLMHMLCCCFFISRPYYCFWFFFQNIFFSFKMLALAY